jgi:Flp pilus assembly protein TadD
MAALHLHIGQLLIMAERWKEAVQALRQARRLGADPAGFNSQLSKALAKTSDQLARDGKIDAAIDAIREAIQLAPEDASLHHHLGHLYALCDR